MKIKDLSLKKKSLIIKGLTIIEVSILLFIAGMFIVGILNENVKLIFDKLFLPIAISWLIIGVPLIFLSGIWGKEVFTLETTDTNLHINLRDCESFKAAFTDAAERFEYVPCNITGPGRYKKASVFMRQRKTSTQLIMIIQMDELNEDTLKDADIIADNLIEAADKSQQLHISVIYCYNSCSSQELRERRYIPEEDWSVKFTRLDAWINTKEGSLYSKISKDGPGSSIIKSNLKELLQMLRLSEILITK